MVSFLTHICITRPQWVNTLTLKQNGHYLADDLFKSIFFNSNYCISNKFKLKYVLKAPINKPKLVYIWVRSRRCGCLVTWFCYQMIAKPGNVTATPSWPDPYELGTKQATGHYLNQCFRCLWFNSLYCILQGILLISAIKMWFKNDTLKYSYIWQGPVNSLHSTKLHASPWCMALFNNLIKSQIIGIPFSLRWN